MGSVKRTEKKVVAPVTPAPKTDPQPDPLPPPPREGSEAWAFELRETLKKLSKESDIIYMKLAEKLFQAWDTPIDDVAGNAPVYTLWGYQKFEEYAFVELGIPKRKAEFLRKIYYTLEVELEALDGRLRERIVALGYSKVRYLVGVLRMDNAEEWLRRAENCTVAELSDLIAQYNQAQRGAAPADGDGDGTGTNNPPAPPPVPDPSETFTERFVLYANQKEMLDLALDSAAKAANTTRKGEQLALICQDFLATNGATPPGTDHFRAYLHNLERVFQVKLVAIDHKVTPNELLYGLEALEELERTQLAAADDAQADPQTDPQAD